MQMPKTITELLGELRTDHRNMSRLLVLLEREVDTIYSNGTPDLGLMAAVMRYMSTFPDAVHHPKEDRLYAELRAVHPEWTGGMRLLSEEHRILEQQGASLMHRLEAANAGCAEFHRAQVADTLRYANALRKHMRWEEKDLFRRLERLIADGHDLADRATVIERPDPLFGDEVEEQFQILYRCITGDQ